MIITIKEHVYAGKRRRIGDIYKPRTASDRRLALAIGWGKPYEEPVKVEPVALPDFPRRMTYQTTAIDAPAEVKRGGFFEAVKRKRGRPRKEEA
jgi:hypothetical protein